MSDANFDSGMDEESGRIGRTSAESRPATVPSQSARERLRQGLSSGMTFYEYLLLASFVFVLLACILMFNNSREFASFPFANPLKTDEAVIGGE